MLRLIIITSLLILEKAARMFAVLDAARQSASEGLSITLEGI